MEDAASTTPSIEGLAQLVISGKIKKLSDIVQTLKIVQDFPRLITDLQGRISTIPQFTIALRQQAQLLTDNIVGVTSGAWIQETDIGNTSDAVRGNITSIQATFRDEISPAVNDIKRRISGIEGLLSVLPFSSGKLPTSEIKVASYQRWSPVRMNMACSRWATQKYQVPGFEKSFGYPQFYNCLYTNTIPWPNHHIPYVKVQFY